MRSVKPKRRKAPTVAKLKKQAWKLLSELVRRSNSKEGGYATCYTCGAMKHWTELHAGHGIGGRTGSVLLDEDLIKPQCPGCNIFRGGQYGIFATKLIREKAELAASRGATTGVALGIGMDWWEAKLSASRQVRKWNRSELEAKIEEYKARLSRL